MGMLRNDLMGPLSAASMEVGSYHRGYDYITRSVLAGKDWGMELAEN